MYDRSELINRALDMADAYQEAAAHELRRLKRMHVQAKNHPTTIEVSRLPKHFPEPFSATADVIRKLIKEIERAERLPKKQGTRT